MCHRVWFMWCQGLNFGLCACGGSSPELSFLKTYFVFFKMCMCVTFVRMLMEDRIKVLLEPELSVDSVKDEIGIHF